MKLRVGILGATGAVGQKMIRLLENHPWFEITALAASSRSASRPYGEAVHWIESEPLSQAIAEIVVQEAKPGLDCDFVLSALDAGAARKIEAEFAEAGFAVISNAKSFRMDKNVPLLIPEVNPNHLSLIEGQSWSGGGFIVTNPNCATIGLVLALKPIYDAFGIEAVTVTTLQALSGAGYPGVASLDAMGNVIPFIEGEEEKLKTEPLKILGELVGGKIMEPELRISAQCTRVPVVEGHLACVSLKTSQEATPAQIKEILTCFEAPTEIRTLPGSPPQPIIVLEEENGPQPRKHAHAGGGMTVSVGRVRKCEILDIKMVVLSHNTVRGAAGGAILTAELLASKGMLRPRKDDVLAFSV